MQTNHMKSYKSLKISTNSREVYMSYIKVVNLHLNLAQHYSKGNFIIFASEG